MDPVSVLEARNRLSALLDQVERGHEVVITRRGKAVARLIPAELPAELPAAEPPDPPRAAAAALRALRAGIAARGVRFDAAELRALRDEGRR
jgi:prevent-host-death family protein